MHMIDTTASTAVRELAQAVSQLPFELAGRGVMALEVSRLQSLLVEADQYDANIRAASAMHLRQQVAAETATLLERVRAFALTPATTLA